MQENNLQTLKLLNEIVSEVLNKKNINLKLNMTAFDVEGWDSLAHTQIIYACEKKFKMRFSLAELGDLKVVEDLINVIIRHQNK